MQVITDPAFFTLILVVITAYYAYWTRRMVTATFEVENLRKKPALVASVSRSEKLDSVAEIKLENYGLSPAFEVKFEVVDDFYLWPPDQSGKGGNKLSELLLISKGFSVLAPKQRIVIPVLLLGQYALDLRDQAHKLIVTYKDSQGLSEKTVLYIDFASVPDHRIGETEETKTRKALEKIQKELNKLNVRSIR